MSFNQKIVLFLLLIFVGACFAQKVDLTTVDLGRHIKNGEEVFKNPEVLRTNFYSYTKPTFKTINHHWLFGVFSWIVWSLGGFKLISLLFVLISVLTFLIFFLSAKKVSSFSNVFLLSIWFLPLILFRKEIRPEAISYLLTAIFIFALLKFSQKEITFKKLCFILIPLQLLWVNTHIFFALGLFLVGVFIVDSVFNKKFSSGVVRNLLFLLTVLILVSFINPAGITGFFEPLNIFKEYGYMVAENQSIFFMQKRFFNVLYLHFELSFILLAVGFLIWFFKERTNFKESIFYFLLFLFFGILGFKLNRFMAIGSLIFLFSGAYIAQKITVPKFVTSFLVSIFIMFCFMSAEFLPFPGKDFGFGVFPESEKSAKFFEDVGIKGPVFNNYDIGSYLIFYLFPKEKVFVDNRPEAYPLNFFKDVYVPMQEKEEVWDKVNDQYKFNVIYFYRHDMTPWAQPFLIKRVEDPKWVTVYVDDLTIIMVRNIEDNKEVIARYALPKSIFGR
ncbi:MAG: hypothetical protein ABIB98_00600 [bacterium]